MKGYKVFDPDWKCRGFQFEVGKTFEEDVEPECCNRGFHFCKELKDCFNSYVFDPNNKVAEVEAVGDIDTHSNDTKCSTNKLRVIREITWHEVIDLVNSGKACTGFCNSGNCNSGDYNSGNRNSGDCNIGNWNSGDHNSGNYNSGKCNSGDHNSGNCNSGDCNSGNWNSGDCNSGNWNSGDHNSGDHNSGDHNSGDYNSGNRNSGDCNIGNWNSGDHNSGNYNSGKCNSGDHNSGNCNSGSRNSGKCNSGDCNSGNWNSGDHNSGDWNKTSNAVGCFNTEHQKLKFFDKETDMTLEQWWNSDARMLMNQICFRSADWILSDDMTDEEKAEHPEHKTTGGYLKIRDNPDCYTEWWNGLSERSKNIIRSIPNFDSEKFYQITGIRA